MSSSQDREAVLFQLALEKPAAERQAFLQVICGEETQLRARLEALLAAHDASEDLLSPQIDAARPTLEVKPSDVSTDEIVGQKIGRYKILERVGEGGCGVVYVAEQTEPVRRRVALKVIKLGMDTKAVVARFEAERQALAMMDHPNIAKVLDGGATDNGRPYFIMELVRGIKITEYCDQANLTTKGRLKLFIEVCQAIQHAHQKGIIHRDIKPSNILVTVNDGVPVPKVIDFGIAKATEGRLTEATVYTQLHQLIGTPAYMSPEQAEMSSLDIDTRSDIYSLGVLLYELLAGCTPFDAKELLSQGIDAMRKTIRELEPVRPSTKLAGLRGDDLTTTAKRRSSPAPMLIRLLQGDLDWIVMKCLEKDRQRRYETANGLAMDIQRYLTGQPVVAAPPSSAYRLKKFLTRNRAAVAAGAAVAAALLLGVIAFAWQAKVARRERDHAILAEAAAKQRAAELAKVSEFQAGMLQQIDANDAGEKLMAGIRAKFGAALEKSGVPEAERATRSEVFGSDLARVNATDTAVEMIDRTILKPAITAIEAQFKDQPLLAAKLRHTLGELYRGLGLDANALALEEQALAARQRILGEDNADTLLSLNDKGVLLEEQGKFAEAEKCYREAYEKRRRLLGEDSRDTITSLGNLGNFLRNRGNFAEAEPLLRTNLAQCRRLFGENHRDTLVAMNCMGYWFVSQGKLADAEPLWRDAYEKGKRALGEDDPDVLVWLSNLGGLLQAQGKFKEAEPYFRESLEKHRRIRGEEHPQTIQAINILAGSLSRQGRFDEAEPLCREALDKSTRVLGRSNPQTLICLDSLGNLLIHESRLGEAETLLRRSLEESRRVRGEEHLGTLATMGQLAKLLLQQGKTSEAEALYRETLQKARKTLGPDNPDTLVFTLNLGNLLLLQTNRLNEAEPLIRQAVDGRRRVSGEDHPETLIALSNLGRLLELQGKTAEAEQVDRDALQKFQRKLGGDHPNTVNATANLASLLRATGKAAEAEPLFRDALAATERKFGKENASTGSARLSLGKVLVSLNRFSDAEPELIEAHRVLAAAEGASVERRQDCVTALINLYEAWNKAEPDQGHSAKAAQWKQKLETAAPTR
jgi:tetratricopeptide (TPR) repeat protein/tRNA A-37 threonylcarbamoyl transferase component Bud32